MKTAVKLAARIICTLTLSMMIVMEPAAAGSFAVDYGPVYNTGSSEPSQECISDQLIILAEPGTKIPELREAADGAGGALETVSTLTDGSRLALIRTDDDLQAAAEAAMECRGVVVAQPNYIYKICTEAPDDPKAESQWYLYSEHREPEGLGETAAGAVDAAGAWELLEEQGIASADPVIAVIDTGLDLDHEDLKNNILRDKCVTINDGEVSQDFKKGDWKYDDDGHGTHVCGIIAADTGNSIGISGTAGNRVKLFCIDAAMPGTLDFGTIDLCKSIDYAVRNGARVINMSIGGLYRDPVLEMSIKNAWDRGVLCVCAAGNEASEGWTAPADSPYAVGVMSHSVTGAYSEFTNYGAEKDVSAPGEGILSTYRNGRYRKLDGTSMASPVAAGLAGMLLSADATLTPREIKNYIYTSSGRDGFNGGTQFSTGGGFGRINYRNALQALLSEDTMPEKIVLNRTHLNMYTGTGDMSVEYEVLPAAAGRHADEVRFFSSDEGVAKVDNEGIVTAVSPGSAVITAYWAGSNSVSSSCSVTVRRPGRTVISTDSFTYTGVLDDTDPIMYVDAGGNDIWGLYCDTYEITLAEGDVLSARAEGYSMLPLIQIMEPSGQVASESWCPDYDAGDENVHRAECELTAKTAGVHTIAVMNCDRDYDTVGKSYTLNVTRKSSGIEPVQLPAVTDEISPAHNSDTDWLGTPGNIPAAKGFKAASAQKKVNVRWKKLKTKKLKKFTHIEIQVCADRNFRRLNTVRKFVRNNRRSAKVRIKRKGTYYVRIRNTNGTGSSRTVSKWSKVKKLRVR